MSRPSRRYVRAMRAGVRAALPIDGRRDRSAGRSRWRLAREKRRWPPGVVKTRSRPASLHRRIVAGETPRMRLASVRPTQSGSRVAGRFTKPMQIYQNIVDSLTVPSEGRGVLRTIDASPRRRHRCEAPRPAVEGLSGSAVHSRSTGEWPSGKAPDSGSGDRRFESFLASHTANVVPGPLRTEPLHSSARANVARPFVR